MLVLLTRFARLAAQRSDVVVASFVLLAVLMMVVPLPTYLVDILVCINIAMGLLILVVAFYTAHSVDFSSLPPIILLSTLFRLALSITTTRLILKDADAGEIVAAFGEFVIAGDVVIGLVVFLVITIGQFVVITKGAERVAEVAARFSLDAMPGKQMSIDTDLRNGDIEQSEARTRRSRLERESQLFGAMDGAMKFVKGDAIACIIILFINLIGGLLIGMLRHGMPFGEAVQTYSTLTVGDGLIAQIPALLTAVAAGTVVTRVASDENQDLGAEIIGQLGANPRALGLTAAMLAVLSLLPGFPAEVFLLIALVPGIAAFLVWRRARAARPADEATPDGFAAAEADNASGAVGSASHADRTNGEDALMTDDLDGAYRLAVHVSPALRDALSIPALRASIEAARSEVAEQLGMALPAIGVRTDALLDGACYRIYLEGIPVFEDVLPEQPVLVDDTAAHLDLLDMTFATGTPLVRADPTLWVAQADAPRLAAAGLAFATREAAMGRHLRKLLHRHAPEFVGIQETRTLLTDMEAAFPELVKEALRSNSIHRVSEVLRRLLDEGTAIRNLRAVLEALAEWGPRDLEVHALSERVRGGLARQICHAHADAHRMVAAYALAKPMEDAIRRALRGADTRRTHTLPAEVSARLLDRLRALYAQATGASTPVVLTAPDIRRYIRQLLVRNDLDLSVMSYADLTREYTAQAVAVITLTDEIAETPSTAAASKAQPELATL